ncbi:hypothetical protein JX265_009477 [Neoarthrinium moseri]|uniref:Uncharacterized protein n=1 Tax=Neoarthrinium moseri TaxID=1658444 RepID=A0A9Q0AL53_9PEZI|nr:hypothetical protein JX265_009477 [Neoarthrinium moseri]
MGIPESSGYTAVSYQSLHIVECRGLAVQASDHGAEHCLIISLPVRARTRSSARLLRSSPGPRSASAAPLSLPTLDDGLDHGDLNAIARHAVVDEKNVEGYEG